MTQNTATPNTPALAVQDLCVRYPKAVADAVHRISFTLSAGEIACLIGPSGCGKTTALRAIAGFATPHVGSIFLNGQAIASPKYSVPPQSRGIGLMFQDVALFPHLDVAGNIAFGLHRLPKFVQTARVNDLLRTVGLVGMGSRYPHQLSGGQQQRVALARALAPKPQVLLLDEPFSSLDAKLRSQLATDIRLILKAEEIGRAHV